jgi:uncharacterized membrane protein
MLYRFAIALALCTACSGAQDTGIEPVTCSTESTLTYENFGKDLIDTNCLECHDTRSPRLETLAQIRTQADEILDTAVYTDAMPEENGMPLQQRELLGEWLACGAP